MDNLQFSDKALNVRCVSFINYAPPMEKKTVNIRRFYSFFIVENGSMTYRYSDKSFFVKKGDVVFLPDESVPYSYEGTHSDTFIRQFTFYFDIDGFSICHNRPVHVTGECAHRIKSTFDEMEKAFNANTVTETIRLCSLIADCMYTLKSAENASEAVSKISPAIEYIKNHTSPKLSVKELAAVCNLSESHFRRVFSKETGISPVKYKNRVIAEKACSYLADGTLSVSEVAEIMGFETLYAFSKAFKNEKGISPKQFLKI